MPGLQQLSCNPSVQSWSTRSKYIVSVHSQNLGRWVHICKHTELETVVVVAERGLTKRKKVMKEERV
jgi:hypothetical protein